MGKKVLDPCLETLEAVGLGRREAEGLRASLMVHLLSVAPVTLSLLVTCS